MKTAPVYNLRTEMKYNTLKWIVSQVKACSLLVLVFTLVTFLFATAAFAEDDKDKGDAPAPAKEAEPVKAGKRAKHAWDLITSEKDIEGIEDPKTLFVAGEHYLKEGNKKLAKACFKASAALEEVNHYSKFDKTPYAEAYVAEAMGDFEASRAIWEEVSKTDIVGTYATVSRMSLDPKKGEFLKTLKGRIDGIVEEAKNGGSPHVYTTKKGASRKLKAITLEEALKAFEAGERLRYVYIEDLDLTNKTFTKPVKCIRCMVGSIKTYGATFEEEFNFKGVVLGDAKLGKHWRGKVNKSAFDAPGQFNRIYLHLDSVVFGNLNMDSVKVTGRVANFPLVVVEGESNFRNVDIKGTAEFRFSVFNGPVNMKGAKLRGAVYFGHAKAGEFDFSRTEVTTHPVYMDSAKFSGPFKMVKSELHRGATFENAEFSELTFRQNRVYDRLNFSRAVFNENIEFSQVQATDVEFLGADIRKEANFSDCVFANSARFSLDGLTRRLHLDKVDDLHPLYKQYQGDVDAEADLTSKSQYGVVSVDDLTARIGGNVSFANTIFQTFVNFEGVRFGQPKGKTKTLANFYNTQFFGEAHFERSEFYSRADFRTISGNEISFNQARFHSAWLLDDANIPGRLSMNGADLVGNATISFYGARIASFGITFRQLIDLDREHRLYYERCLKAKNDNAAFVDDTRLEDAKWDAQKEEAITDEKAISWNTRKICMERAVGEFVALKDSFRKRGRAQETDWAYWHLRHYKNHRNIVTNEFPMKMAYYLEWIVFEWGFGWGVRLQNLLGTGLVVILVFMGILRIFCAEMTIDWDGKPTHYKDLPLWGMFIVSFHCFLGRARDWKATKTPSAWKAIYTTEVIIGIILVTFFIGAYTRKILS